MEKYIKLETLGQGTYGNVILVKSLEKKKYAIKKIIVENDENQGEKIQNEIKILNNLDHENIIKYIESFNHKKKFCIVMEYADGGDLQSIIKQNIEDGSSVDEEKIWDWFYQLAKALEYIHSKKIIHRDIKGQNILLSRKGVIKLGDFGVSKILESTHDFAKTSLGTPYFLSPEICSGSIYNSKSDVWMLGCVLYECCSLKKPFEADTFHNLMKVIINNKQMPIPKKYSQDMNQLIENLLEKNPNIRPSIIDILNEDYIKKNIAKYIINDTKFKQKIDENTIEYDSKASSSIQTNYRSENSSVTGENLSPQINRIPLEGKINYQNYAQVKEKFNSFKKDILRKKKYSPSYNNDQIQNIINNLEISPIHLLKESEHKNITEHVLTHFNLSTIEKDKVEQKVENVIVKNKNEPNLSAKRGHSRQISFNISSSQYIVNEISNLDSNLNLRKNTSGIKIENLKDSIIKKNSLHYNKLSELISKNKNLELNVNFVINKIGKEKYVCLLEFLEQSENPIEFIQSSEVAQKICGKDYASVVNMLKKIIITALSSVVK